jgi:hypothetical protein
MDHKLFSFLWFWVIRYSQNKLAVPFKMPSTRYAHLGRTERSEQQYEASQDNELDELRFKLFP